MPARRRSSRSTHRWPIATWKPIVDLLTAAGVAHTSGNVTTLDVAAYMKLVDANTRWKDLPGNTAYPVNKSILITLDGRA